MDAHDIMLACGAVAAFITAVKIITGWGPVRWVWHKLIIEPVSSTLNTTIDQRIAPAMEANRQDIQEILSEVRPNGGNSMKDHLTRLMPEVEHVSEEVREVRRDYASLAVHMGTAEGHILEMRKDIVTNAVERKKIGDRLQNVEAIVLDTRETINKEQSA